VHFNDGTVKEINLEPVLYGGLYKPLRKHDLFSQVTVDDEVGTVVWPNGADFEPDLLYAWDEYVDTFASQMSKIG
jgi:hypothetical protein